MGWVSHKILVTSPEAKFLFSLFWAFWGFGLWTGTWPRACQKHDSFSNKEIKHTNASNSEEEIQEENTDPKTREEIKDQNTDEIIMKTNENQSSNSQITDITY